MSASFLVDSIIKCLFKRAWKIRLGICQIELFYDFKNNSLKINRTPSLTDIKTTHR